MRIYFDTEFIEFGKELHLVSLGAVSQFGYTYYAESNEFDPELASPWVKQNVLTQLGTVPAMTMNLHEMADSFESWVKALGPGPRGRETSTTPEFWGYFADWDWLILCQLFDGMMNVPDGWPMLCLDIKQEQIRLGHPKVPVQTTREHFALNDAVWTKEAHEYLRLYEDDMARAGKFIVNGRTITRGQFAYPGGVVTNSIADEKEIL